MDVTEWIRLSELEFQIEEISQNKGEKDKEKKYINEKLKDKENRCRGTHI